MQILSTGKMRRSSNVEHEADVLQALATLEYLAIDRAGGRLLKNQAVLIAQAPDCAKIEEAGAMEELLRATGRNAPKSERDMESLHRREFKEARNQWLVAWGRATEILEKEVDNYHEMENYEPEEQKKANNAIKASELTGLQYEPTQGNGKI